MVGIPDILVVDDPVGVAVRSAVELSEGYCVRGRKWVGSTLGDVELGVGFGVEAGAKVFPVGWDAGSVVRVGRIVGDVGSDISVGRGGG